MRSMIVVAGALANKPLNGGEAWVRLTWALAAMRLGHEVHLEQIAPPTDVSTPAGVESPSGTHRTRPSFQRVVQDFGLKRSATLICGDGEATLGLSLAQVEALMERADLLLNISGYLRIEPLLERARLKAYVDLDPTSDACRSRRSAPSAAGGRAGGPSASSCLLSSRATTKPTSSLRRSRACSLRATRTSSSLLSTTARWTTPLRSPPVTRV